MHSFFIGCISGLNLTSVIFAHDALLNSDAGSVGLFLGVEERNSTKEDNDV